MTLEHAEETIAKTASARREFLANVLTELRVLEPDEIRSLQQKAIGY
jgi:hypothetical protein